METCSLIRFHQLRPSPKSGRVGSCVSRFEACSAFTHVTACMLAESPLRPSAPEASAVSLPPLLLRLLPGGANQFPGGLLPLWTTAFHDAPGFPTSRDLNIPKREDSILRASFYGQVRDWRCNGACGVCSKSKLSNMLLAAASRDVRARKP